MRPHQVHLYTTVFGLSEKMRSRGATNVSLGEAAGVATRTVQNMRSGKWVRSNLAEAVLQALEEREFKLKKRGPKRNDAK